MFDIPLLINLSTSLIELEHQLKNQIIERTCKSKVDKITYPKSYLRTTYDVSKNKPSVYPKALSTLVLKPNGCNAFSRSQISLLINL